jgi:hypothetical protein
LATRAGLGLEIAFRTSDTVVRNSPNAADLNRIYILRRVTADFKSFSVEFHGLLISQKEPTGRVSLSTFRKSRQNHHSSSVVFEINKGSYGKEKTKIRWAAGWMQ